MKRFELFVAILFILISKAYAQENIKYHAEWDAGFNITAPWEGGILPTINTIHGVRFADRFSVGAGIGYNANLAYQIHLMPIYANIKYIFPSKKRTRPFVSADIGYSAISPKEDGYSFAGLYFSPSIGLKKSRFKFQIGYTAQQLRFTYNSSGSKYISSAGHIRFGMIF